MEDSKTLERTTSDAAAFTPHEHPIPFEKEIYAEYKNAFSRGLPIDNDFLARLMTEELFSGIAFDDCEFIPESEDLVRPVMRFYLSNDDAWCVLALPQYGGDGLRTADMELYHEGTTRPSQRNLYRAMDAFWMVLHAEVGGQ